MKQEAGQGLNKERNGDFTTTTRPYNIRGIASVLRVLEANGVEGYKISSEEACTESGYPILKVTLNIPENAPVTPVKLLSIAEEASEDLLNEQARNLPDEESEQYASEGNIYAYDDSEAGRQFIDRRVKEYLQQAGIILSEESSQA